jgi:ABC-type transport system involved in multi-copper enzyme maturation permease subunit
MLTIAFMTWKELLRKRVLLITLLLTAALLGLFGYVSHLAVADFSNTPTSLVQRFMTSTLLLVFGMFVSSFVAVFFVAFSTMGTIAAELENGLLLAVLARPLPRWRIYMGKWIGFAVAALLYCLLLYGGMTGLLAIVLEYWLPWDVVIKGYLLFGSMSLVIVSVSMLGSTYMSTIGNGVATALLFCMGLFGGMLDRFAALSGVVVNVAAIEKFTLLISLIMPADSLLRRMSYELIGGSSVTFVSEAFLGPFGVGNAPSNAYLLYCAFYVAVLLLWGCVHFTRKDI